MAEPKTNKDPVLNGASSRHVEDPTIEQLAEEAEHTDDVAERLLDLLVVFVLLVVGGYVAFGRTILPDLFVVYLTGAALAVAIVAGLAGMYYIAPRLAHLFPAEVRRIGRLFREGVLHSFR